MENSDLSRLRIESEQRLSQSGGKRRKRRLWLIVPSVVLVFAIAYLGWTGRLVAPADVQTAKVALTFPSRALTVLNASGYVVGQRKAASPPKPLADSTNFLWKREKRVKNGDVIGVLENEDLKATLEEARAALKVAKGNLNNAEAELHDASLNFDRQKALRESGSVSQQSFDSAEARYKKALASEVSARFGVDRTEASIRGCRSELGIFVHPGPV